MGRITLTITVKFAREGGWTETDSLSGLVGFFKGGEVGLAQVLGRDLGQAGAEAYSGALGPPSLSGVGPFDPGPAVIVFEVDPRAAEGPPSDPAHWG